MMIGGMAELDMFVASIKVPGELMATSFGITWRIGQQLATPETGPPPAAS